MPKENIFIKTKSRKNIIYYIFILLEVIMIILYGLFTNFGKLTHPKNFLHEEINSIEEIKKLYPIFQDIQVMIFIGIGFLLSFLKRYSWSAVSKNFLLAAWTIQLSILTIGFWKAVLKNEWEEKIEIDLWKLMDADFAAATILISFAGVMGKMSFIQYLCMATIENIIYSLEMSICFINFKIVDLGGTITIHLFSSIFGLTVALITKRSEVENHPNLKSNYTSNLMAMIGTLFLWIYWPSFNAAFASGLAQYRAIINTLFSLIGSCVMVFLITPIFKEGKLHMENILNSTLSGGVLIGAVCDIIIDPWASFLIGCFGGILSTVGYEYIQSFMMRKIGLHDTAGILSLHLITSYVEVSFQLL